MNKARPIPRSRSAAAWGTAALGAISFLWLALHVNGREGSGYDLALYTAARSGTEPGAPVGPRWVEELARDMTGLGGIPLLVAFQAAVAVFLLLDRRRREALYLAVTTAGGWALLFAVKALIARPRPDVELHRTAVYTASFPSGHALMAAITYLTVAALMTHEITRTRTKVFVMACASAITLLVGASRVYLGVHWPTDVLGGWLCGMSWTALCWLTLRKYPVGEDRAD